MKPPLPEPAIAKSQLTLNTCILGGALYIEAQLLAYRAEVIEMCASSLLEAGFRSTGIPAYESLAERLRDLK